MPWLRWRRFSYLLKEMLGAFDLEDRFVYVSDGGHLENFGLLELLARRSRLIVCCDASGDGYDAATTPPAWPARCATACGWPTTASASRSRRSRPRARRSRSSLADDDHAHPFAAAVAAARARRSMPAPAGCEALAGKPGARLA